MKIFHIMSNRTWGGGEVYVLTLAKEQRENGHSVEIICADRPPVVDRFKKEGVKVTVLQMHGQINLFAPRKFARMIRKSYQPTVVHVHRIPDTVFASKAISLLPEDRRPSFIMTHHLIDLPFTDKKFDRPYEMLDRIICVSQKSKDTLLSVKSHIDPTKVTAILNSTKVVTTKSPENKPKDRPAMITYVGRVVKEKGVDTLIEALARVQGATLTICGGGASEKDEYVTYLHKLADRINVNDRINWTGFTTDVTKYIGEADIAVIPSRWQEPCALVNFEFLAAGVPLVTSNTGGQPEIISEGIDGLLVPPNDPKALAEAIQRLVDDPDLRKKMGEAAREKFLNRFTYDKFYQRVMSVYDEALGK